ncbi:MAG: bifunctional glutamate N-acetyltransferase/amino-acid acetyltransferase ArgJ [Christensenellales bacterium]|jgi:glutamate N-acetyltransferase/amino-acid N-acetyltransferase
MKIIPGGVCAAKGYRAGGIYCGIRKNPHKKDLALIVSENAASTASVYTQNLVVGAPILVTRQNTQNGYAQAIFCNSGNANTCNANGVEIAERMCALLEQHLNIPQHDVIVASTGVIGKPLDIAPIEAGMGPLCASLGADSDAAAQAIMTTDTLLKQCAVEFELGGVPCRIGGIAKGSGMIHPNMATLLSFLTSDAAISPAMLQKALQTAVDETFNMVSIDGDTSTNDMVSILCNAQAQNAEIVCEDQAFHTFLNALKYVCLTLSQLIAKDGEGATKLLECRVAGASDIPTARTVAKSVICSSLFKAAMFGADANWGRVLCAIGYSGAQVDVNKIDVSFASAAGRIDVCKNGSGLPFDETLAKRVLSQDEIVIDIALHSADANAIAWGCDLTYDYVRINGDYRS